MKQAVPRRPCRAIAVHGLLHTAGVVKHLHENDLAVGDDDFLRVEATDCPMSSCAATAGSPCRTGKGWVAASAALPGSGSCPTWQGPQRPFPRSASRARPGPSCPPGGARHRASGVRADRVCPRLYRPPVPRHPGRLAQSRGRHTDLRREDLHPRRHPSRARPGRGAGPGPARVQATSRPGPAARPSGAPPSPTTQCSPWPCTCPVRVCGWHWHRQLHWIPGTPGTRSAMSTAMASAPRTSPASGRQPPAGLLTYL